MGAYCVSIDIASDRSIRLRDSRSSRSLLNRESDIRQCMKEKIFDFRLKLNFKLVKGENPIF